MGPLDIKAKVRSAELGSLGTETGVLNSEPKEVRKSGSLREKLEAVGGGVMCSSMGV